MASNFMVNAYALVVAYFSHCTADWEYPTDPERGGRPSDRAGFAALLKEYRAAIAASGQPFLLTVALAAGAGGYAGEGAGCWRR